MLATRRRPPTRQLRIRLSEQFINRFKKEAMKWKVPVSTVIAQHIESTADVDFDTEAIAFTPSPRIKAELEAAATYNGRTIEEELADRVTDSFRNAIPDFNAPLPPHLRAAINALVDLLNSLEMYTGRKFGRDLWLHRQAAAAVALWFQIHEPPGAEEPPSGEAADQVSLRQRLLDRFGEVVAVLHADRPEQFSMAEAWYAWNYLDLTPPDPRLAIAPRQGSALLRESRDEELGRRDPERVRRAGRLVMDHPLPPLAGKRRRSG